jgi:hypothetical protein
MTLTRYINFFPTPFLSFTSIIARFLEATIKCNIEIADFTRAMGVDK